MIHIIGGGISGLATALTLQKNGIAYNLFEKDTEITYDNVGLGISYNIRPILKDWNILEETKQIGTEITQLHFVDYNLTYLKSFTLKQPPLCVNRKQFHEILSRQLDNKNIFLNTTKSVTDFDSNEIVISAEGIHSTFRKSLYPDLNFRKANQTLWRGISEINLEPKFKNAYHNFIGNNIQFAIIHTGGNAYSWYIIKPLTANAESQSKETLKYFFDGCHPIIQSVIEQTKDIYTSELMDINPHSRKDLNWFHENALMIGDAIHPTTPNMANGACLAMEDAYTVGNLISQNPLATRNIFQKFQQQRKSKVDRIVFQSWILGKLLHQPNPIAYKIIKAGISLMPYFLFKSIYSNVLKDK